MMWFIQYILNPEFWASFFSIQEIEVKLPVDIKGRDQSSVYRWSWGIANVSPETISLCNKYGNCFPGGTSGEELAYQCRRHKRCGFDPWVGKTPLEESMATHSGLLAWRIPWSEEPGRLQSMGSQSQTRLKWLSMHAHFCLHLYICCYCCTWNSIAPILQTGYSLLIFPNYLSSFCCWNDIPSLLWLEK